MACGQNNRAVAGQGAGNKPQTLQTLKMPRKAMSGSLAKTRTVL